MTVITGDKIRVARMMALRGALRLEMHGMRRRGRSVATIIKQEFGLKGNNKKVYEEFDLLVKAEQEKLQ